MKLCYNRITKEVYLFRVILDVKIILILFQFVRILVIILLKEMSIRTREIIVIKME
jgi:hypothetical protein